MTDIGYLGALVGGVLSLLSPCSVMLLPAFFAYAFSNPATLLARTGIFYLGLVATLVPLGVLAGAVGSFLLTNQSVLIGIAATLLIILGLVQLLGIPLPSFGRSDSKDTGTSLTVFALGAAYGVAGVCTGPILGSVLTLAAVGGNPVYGGILLAIYAAGMAAPLLVLSLGWKSLSKRHRGLIRPRLVHIGGWSNSWHAIISGSFSLALGAFLLIAGVDGLGSVLPASTLFVVESWVAAIGTSIPNLLVMVLAVAGAAAIIGLVALRRARRRRADQRAQAETALVSDAVDAGRKR